MYIYIFIYSANVSSGLYIYRYTYDDIDTTDLLGMGFTYIHMNHHMT
jgi:hypothetical protein